MGAADQVRALAGRVVHVPLDNPRGTAGALNVLHEAGTDDQLAALLARDPAAHAALDNPYATASLLKALHQAGAAEQARALAARAVLNGSLGAVWLDVLREVGADDQVAALLARDPAAHAALDNPDATTKLLDVLGKVGAAGQAELLIRRLPADGLFGLFREQANHRALYKFGREVDGRAAPMWRWEDLD